jgi:hypothetical protein
MNLFGNYSEHPTNINYTVFKFKEEASALYFKNELTSNNIWFEEDVDSKDGLLLYFYAVKKSSLKAVRDINYIAIGKYRKPFISNKYFRIVLLSVFVFVMMIAIIGALKS